MKFLVVFFFAVTMLVAVQAQTESITDIIDDIEEELAADDYYYDYDSYYSDYTSPDYYSYYSTDDVTTAKPFKQQLLSMLFNKKG
ncbi:hypothetical protein KR044_009583 [Drosophila immigrans]|nr:hypothetical protein KR044_009583 [Drosophila immigrans]